jgi:hypothetical protein
MGSLLKSVHKFLGILARNKKYANFLIIGRHGDGACSFLSYLFHFKAFFIKVWSERRELHKPICLNLSIFCANESEVSVVPPPHLFSYMFFIRHKRERENKCNKVFLIIIKLYSMIHL